MNKKTLNKVLVELKKDTPDLSYIRGLLEVLVDSDDEPMERSSVAERPAVNGKVVGSTPTAPADPEAAILDGMAAAKLAEIKRMSNA